MFNIIEQGLHRNLFDIALVLWMFVIYMWGKSMHDKIKKLEKFCYANKKIEETPTTP